MLSDFYSTLKVYEDVNTDFENPPGDDDLTLKGQIVGFVQLRGGSRDSGNQSLMSLSTHILYCPIGTQITPGDYVLSGELYFLVEYVPPESGISGMYDHLECGLVYQSDIRDV